MPDDEIAVGEYLRVLLRRWYIVVVATLVTLGGTAGFYMAQPITFESTALLLVNENFTKTTFVRILLETTSPIRAKDHQDGVLLLTSMAPTDEQANRQITEAIDHVRSLVLASLPDYGAQATQLQELIKLAIDQDSEAVRFLLITALLEYQKKVASAVDPSPSFPLLLINSNNDVAKLVIAMEGQRQDLLLKQRKASDTLLTELSSPLAKLQSKPFTQRLLLAGVLGIMLGVMGAFGAHWWQTESRERH